MKKCKRYDIRPVDLPQFMKDHVDECIVFREMHVDLMCLDIVQEVSESEYYMNVLCELLLDDSAGIVEEEKAAIEYAIECIKTLDDMGILKEGAKADE